MSSPKAPKARPATTSASTQIAQRPTDTEVVRATTPSSTMPTTSVASADSTAFWVMMVPGPTRPRPRRDSTPSSRSAESSAADSSTPSRPRPTTSAAAMPSADSGSRPGAPDWMSSRMGLAMLLAAGLARSRLVLTPSMKSFSAASRFASAG